MALGRVVVKADADDARSKRGQIMDAGRLAHVAAQQRLEGLEGELFGGFDIAPLLTHAPAIVGLRALLDDQRNGRDGLA